ncbi:hypothetical protein [Hymenobacter sedentarius]|uniref:hypothetical protein n=1 Tax=Hymenobacter sedentarius TaxID=1411621 RepID=UPI0012FE2AEB|nr:hypothetical protein [Hymenobacter sedentarius]
MPTAPAVQDLKRADVVIVLRGYEEGGTRYLGYTYAQFEETMERLGLEDLTDPWFYELWTITLSPPSTAKA